MNKQRIGQVVSSLRRNFELVRGQKTKTYEWREQQLKQFVRMLEENQDSFKRALYKDLRQTKLIQFTEVELLVQEALHALSSLKSWMKDEDRPYNSLLFLPGRGRIKKEPYGVVLVIGAWNYPLTALLKPAVGAIAAGNCVVLKPSEVSENCSSLCAELIPKYLDTEHIQVIEGDAQVASELLKQKFDYIFFTGNPQIGRLIMRAASDHLTPVTLELGGKSPCIVDKEVNMDIAVKRIVFGKFTNVGQTCVSPDYILLHKSVENEFIDKVKSALKEFYTENIQQSPDYSRMINLRHTQRVMKLIKSAEDHVIYGGKCDESDLYIEPTLVLNPPKDCELMTEEIFGPVLPILTYTDLDNAVEFIKSRPRPLTLYVFSDNRRNIDFVIDSTHSGGVAINDCVGQVAINTLPFGGVGESGMGTYNGKTTFDTFSHAKSILDKPTYLDLKQKYPPFSDFTINSLKKVARLPIPLFVISHFKLVAIFAMLSIIFVAYTLLIRK